MISSKHDRQITESAKSSDSYSNFKEEIRTLDETEEYKETLRKSLDDARTDFINKTDKKGSRIREYIYQGLFATSIIVGVYFQSQILDLQREIFELQKSQTVICDIKE